jgi:hypothetical protein
MCRSSAGNFLNRPNLASDPPGRLVTVAKLARSGTLRRNGIGTEGSSKGCASEREAGIPGAKRSMGRVSLAGRRLPAVRGTALAFWRGAPFSRGPAIVFGCCWVTDAISRSS